MKRAIYLVAVLALLAAFGGGLVVNAAYDYLAPLEAEYVQTVDSAFTMAFVGDTQNVCFEAPEKMDVIYDWIIDSKDEKNIKYVAGLGDITDEDLDYEWEAAMAAINQLNGVIPHSIVRGNHDMIYNYGKYVNRKSPEYVAQLSGVSPEGLNSYQLLDVGTIKYLFINLDNGATNEMLAWAAGIIEQYPDRNVIITTHSYINEAGELLTTENSKYPPSVKGGPGTNDGPEMWDGLIRKYANIVMVVCGHIGGAPEVVAYEMTGDHGNKIQNVLVDPQSADTHAGLLGLVALFHFSADGKQVQVENYSTLQNDHYGPGITFELECLGGNANAGAMNWPLLVGIGIGVLVIAAAAAVCVIVMKKKKAQAQ